MKTIASWVARYPVRALAVAQAILAALTPILPSGVTTALLGVLAALLGVGVHQAVTPVATAVESISQAAISAATNVARDLDETAAGVAGDITLAGEHVIDQAVNKALGTLAGPR